MMPYETGDYRELKFFEQIFDSGRLKDLPGYAVRVLWCLIRHANFPSGWTWPGRERLERNAGLNRQYQLRGLYYLARKGLFSAWGYAKTRGQKSLAFQLSLGLPQGLLPTAREINKELRDYSSPEGKGEKGGLLLVNLGTTLGQPWDYIKIKESITLKNPKEPRDSFSQDTKSKSSLLRGLCDEFKEFEVSLRSDWDFYVDKSKQNPDEVYSKLKKKALEGLYKPAD